MKDDGIGFIPDKDPDNLGFIPDEDPDGLGFVPDDIDFQPDAPLVEELKIEREKELEALKLGALQGASLGFADELEGGLQAGKEVLVGDAKLANLLDEYRRQRDLARAEYEQAKLDAPNAFLAGELAGGVGSAVLTGGLGAGVRGAAAMGAIAGAGSSDTDVTGLDPEQLKEMASDAATGGAVGGALGAAAKGVGSVISRASNPDKGGYLSKLVESYKRGTKGQDLTSKKAAQEMADELLASGESVLEDLGSAEARASKDYGNVVASGKENLKLDEFKKILKGYSESLETIKNVTSSPDDLALINSFITEVDSVVKDPKINYEKIKNLGNKLKGGGELGQKAKDFYDLTNKLTELSTDLTKNIKQNLPGLDSASKKVHEIKNIKSLLGDYSKYNAKEVLNKEAQTAANISKSEDATLAGAKVRELLGRMKEIPEVNQENITRIVDLSDSLKLAKEVQKPIDNISKLAPTVALKAANVAGSTPVLKGAVEATKGVIKATPAVSQGVARVAQQDSEGFASRSDLSEQEIDKALYDLTGKEDSKSVKLKSELNELKSADPARRKALLFKLSQDKAYRELINK